MRWGLPPLINTCSNSLLSNMRLGFFPIRRHDTKENKTYFKNKGWGEGLILMLLAIAFLLNRVLDEYLWKMRVVFIDIFPGGFGLKNCAFSPNPQRKYNKKLYFLGTTCMSGVGLGVKPVPAHREQKALCPTRMGHVALASCAVFAFFFVF